MTNEMNDKLEEETKGFINRIGEIFTSTKSTKKEEDDEGVAGEKEMNDEDTSKKQPDFITIADFDEFKSEIIELVTAMNDKVNEIVKASSKSDDAESDDMVEGLTPEEEKELERLLAKKEASTKSEQDDDEEEEEDDEEEIKASSKSTPVHDTGVKSKSQLTDSAIVYSIMGRDNTGSAKKH